jgi:hypothetical protein
MNNAPAIFRSLIVYALCVPLAITVGYLLTNPLDYSTAAIYGVLGLLLILPILLRWHYPLMLLCFNMSIVVFFLKGRPNFGMVVMALSLVISILERILSSERSFIRVPRVTWPLICLTIVVVFTAKLTGGFGFRALGSEVYGGKKYLYVLMGILTYFAFTAQRISPQNARLYASLYLLGGVTNLVGDLAPIIPSGFKFIFLIFPPSIYRGDTFEMGVTRLGGVSAAASAIYCWLLAMYGLRGVLFGGKSWRLVLFALAFVLSFLGGFRVVLFGNIFTFGMLFLLEKLYRTRLLMVFVLAGTLGAVAVVPLARHLPFTFQRALTFLPLPLDLDSDARLSADASANWRFEMWKALLPQIPPHLLLGKGYAISMEDFQMMGGAVAFHSVDITQEGLALSGDYHSGPLSVIIPFGIWGVVAFLWLLTGSTWVMYCNYRYGDESLRTINTFLWVSCLLFIIRFLFIFGGLNGDLMALAGMVGFSIALNGGVRQPAPQPVQAQPTMVYPAKTLPHPRPVFHH